MTLTSRCVKMCYLLWYSTNVIQHFKRIILDSAYCKGIGKIIEWRVVWRDCDSCLFTCTQEHMLHFEGLYFNVPPLQLVSLQSGIISTTPTHFGKYTWIDTTLQLSSNVIQISLAAFGFTARHGWDIHIK